MTTLKNKEVLAVIIARKGSKGVKGKNIKSLAGKPLISYSIEAALNSPEVDEIVVSTDSSDIMKICDDYGVSVPFTRPDYLSSDTSKSMDVVSHAVSYYEKKGVGFKYILLLQPTSPFRTSVDITEAVKIIKSKGFDSVIGIAETKFHPSTCFELDPNYKINKELVLGHSKSNRQELGKTFKINGAIYIVKWNLFIDKKTFYFDNTFGYLMSELKSTDIDTEFDFLIAEALMNEKNKGE
jgi:CMP-N-acetylneuraminic acid synthetase